MIRLLLSVSVVALAALTWLIYFNPFQIAPTAFSAHLPLVNAVLNSVSALCLVGGLVAIIKKKTQTHKRFMIGAFICSTLFLVSYIIYHAIQGDTAFLGTGIVRPIYFFILITHIVLSFVALPIILITFYFALTQRFDSHKKMARWTWPLWMYVSVTGVLIYVFLKAFD